MECDLFCFGASEILLKNYFMVLSCHVETVKTFYNK